MESDRPGCGSFVWLLVLVTIAFIVGMAIRFQRETGDSWLGSVFEKLRISMEGPAALPVENPAAPAADEKAAGD